MTTRRGHARTCTHRRDLDAVVYLQGDLTTTMPAEKGDIKAATFVVHGSKDPVAPKPDHDALEADLDGAEANWQTLDFGGACIRLWKKKTFRFKDCTKVINLTDKLSGRAVAPKASAALKS